MSLHSCFILLMDNLDLWHFVKILVFSSLLMFLSTEAVLSLITPRAVLFLTTGIKSFNYSVTEFLPSWQGMIESNLIPGPAKHPLFLLQRLTLPMPCCSSFITPMPAFATPSAYLRRQETSLWITFQKKNCCYDSLAYNPCQVTLLTTTKASATLTFLNTFRSHFYRTSNVSMRSNDPRL